MSRDCSLNLITDMYITVCLFVLMLNSFTFKSTIFSYVRAISCLLGLNQCNMYGVYLFNMFTKFPLTQILEILMVNKLLKTRCLFDYIRFF